MGQSELTKVPQVRLGCLDSYQDSMIQSHGPLKKISTSYADYRRFCKVIKGGGK